jgi:hypothetical protein
MKYHKVTKKFVTHPRKQYCSRAPLRQSQNSYFTLTLGVLKFEN